MAVDVLMLINHVWLVAISNALRDFQRYLSPHIRTEKPVVHISLNPHPDDVLTDMDMENIAREYLERMGYGLSLIHI